MRHDDADAHAAVLRAREPSDMNARKGINMGCACAAETWAAATPRVGAHTAHYGARHVLGVHGASEGVVTD